MILSFLISAALIAAATIADGWSQHHMLYTNGGKGVEANTGVYGRLPSYWAYYRVNAPIAMAYIGMLAAAHFHWQNNWSVLGIALPLVGWHAYGFYLNSQNFK